MFVFPEAFGPMTTSILERRVPDGVIKYPSFQGAFLFTTKSAFQLIFLVYTRYFSVDNGGCVCPFFRVVK